MNTRTRTYVRARDSCSGRGAAPARSEVGVARYQVGRGFLLEQAVQCSAVQCSIAWEDDGIFYETMVFGSGVVKLGSGPGKSKERH